MTRFAQPAPELADPYEADPVLTGWLDRLLGPDGHAAAKDRLAALAADVLGPLRDAHHDAENHPPRLVRYDGWGRRVDRVETSPGWETQRVAAARHAIVALPYLPDARRTWGAGTRVLQQALLHIYGPESATFTCPVAMADGAAALLACDLLWEVGLSRTELEGLACELGSDVPFSLLGGVALGSGRGEQISPVLARGQTHWVLGIARIGLSTPAVYAELDRLRDEGRVPDGTEPTPADGVLAALRTGPPSALAASLINDLQAPAVSLRPDLRRALRAAEQAGALAALVSGSGPTVAALAEDADGAVRLAAALAGEGVFRTVRAVHGPVPGARLI